MKKMLRRALLGGAAVAMMAAGAQAGELEALKAQLEALQARVATMEVAASRLPAGASLLTIERGHSGAYDELFANRSLDRVPTSRGVTIAVTPTADLPAPAATIELSGYVRALATWSDSVSARTGRWAFDSAPPPGGDGIVTAPPALAPWDAIIHRGEGATGRPTDFDLAARGQVDLSVTMDTAVGRVVAGMQFRGDMTALDNTPSLNIRTAWATWQMTDALSLTFGQTSQIAALSNVSYGTINTPFGLDNTRRPQLRLTYASGPFNFRFGIEDESAYGVRPGGIASTQLFNAGVPTAWNGQPYPGGAGSAASLGAIAAGIGGGISQQSFGTITYRGRTTMPDFAASLGMNMGMFGFRVGGEIGKVGAEGFTDGNGVAYPQFRKTGWLVNAGVNMNLGSMATFSVGGAYTKGLGCDGLISTGNRLPCWSYTDVAIADLPTGSIVAPTNPKLVKAWAVQGNLAVNMTETVTMNATAGYFRNRTPDVDGETYKNGYSLTGNIVYQPVDALRFGLEAHRFVAKQFDGDKDKGWTVGILTQFNF